MCVSVIFPGKFACRFARRFPTIICAMTFQEQLENGLRSGLDPAKLFASGLGSPQASRRISGPSAPADGAILSLLRENWISGVPSFRFRSGERASFVSPLRTAAFSGGSRIAALTVLSGQGRGCSAPRGRVGLEKRMRQPAGFPDLQQRAITGIFRPHLNNRHSDCPYGLAGRTGDPPFFGLLVASPFVPIERKEAGLCLL